LKAIKLIQENSREKKNQENRSFNKKGKRRSENFEEEGKEKEGKKERIDLGNLIKIDLKRVKRTKLMIKGTKRMLGV